MRVRFEWNQRDWKHAVALANRVKSRRSNIPGMTIALVGIPLVGGAISGFGALRRVSTDSLHGSALPVLLPLLLFAVAALVFARLRKKKTSPQWNVEMPVGECQAFFHEEGYQISATVGRDSLRIIPWTALIGARQDDQAVVLLHRGGFSALPCLALNADQFSYLQRLIGRKLQTEGTDADRENLRHR